ncbi:MAG: hypothetical protein WEE36_06415 [Acidimicrobiia bacterium]
MIRRHAVGSVGGLALTALVVVAIPRLTRRYERSRLFFDFDGFWGFTLLIVLLGIVVGSAIAFRRRHPMLVIVPAVLLAIAYTIVPPIGPRSGGILPASLASRIASGFGAATVVLVGVLVAVALWGPWRPSKRVSGQPVPDRRRQLFGVAAGLALALGFLTLFGRLTVDLISHGSFGETGALRWAALGLFALGTAVGGVIIVGERLPTMTITLIGVMVAVFLVQSIPIAQPNGWLLDLWIWFRWFRWATIEPAVPLTVGILVGSVAWRRWFERRPEPAAT